MKTELRDKEIQARSLLYHRYGLTAKNTSLDEETISIEDLDFETAVNELKRSYRDFIETKDFQDRILSLIVSTFAARHHRIPEKESWTLLHTISTFLQHFQIGNEDNEIIEHLKKQQLVIIPLKTFFIEDQNGNTSHENDHQDSKTLPFPKRKREHIKAIALFDERLLKINPSGLHRHPGVRVYRVKPYSFSDMESLLKTFRDSFENPLDHQNWDQTLNTITHAEKINPIVKKEQNVGNGAWLTAKMIILATTYAVIYQYCHAKDIKELEAEPLATRIAEGVYKLFIVDDRNRAVKEYLALHGFDKFILPGDTLTVRYRLDSIKEFLSIPIDKRFPADKTMLEAIYLKSLNWLLADYLKKGDIGAAHALIEMEEGNRQWNPLIYAAKNDKIAIVELLASHARFMIRKDKTGNLAIHYAVQNRNMDILKILLRYQKKNKLNLLAKNAEGNTPLHLAAMMNQLEIIEVLLQNEADLLNMKNDKDETALKIACDNDNTNTIKKLIMLGASLEGIAPEKYSEEIRSQLQRSGRPTLL